MSGDDTTWAPRERPTTFVPVTVCYAITTPGMDESVAPRHRVLRRRRRRPLANEHTTGNADGRPSSWPPATAGDASRLDAMRGRYQPSVAMVAERRMRRLENRSGFGSDEGSNPLPLLKSRTQYWAVAASLLLPSAARRTARGPPGVA